MKLKNSEKALVLFYYLCKEDMKEDEKLYIMTDIFKIKK